MCCSKLKAGALQLTVFIIVIIALLLSAFILLIHTHNRFKAQTDFIIETTRNADKGIKYALQNTTKLSDTVFVDLKDEPHKTLKVHRNFWGVFEKITAIAQIKNSVFKKTALIGAKQSNYNRTALYIQDNNRPLVLVGNAKIEGLAYLPKQGVKSGTISGQSYYGAQLIYGQSKISTDLPKVFTETVNHIKAIEPSLLSLPQNKYISFEIGKDYKNSFFDPIKIIFSNTDIILTSTQLRGHILVHSKTKIVVEASAHLKDVVLVAPEIEIQNQVKGNFQAIASKLVSLGEFVQLNYPSALILNEKRLSTQSTTTGLTKEENKIYIGPNTRIEGLVMYWGDQRLNNFNAQVQIEENAVIYGELYCNQNTELIGTVYGSVYTNNFVAKQFGSIYQNHIYNGKIIVNELFDEYVGLVFNDSKKEILKWLY